MDGRIALAAVAGRKRVGHDEDQQSILFAHSYGQINYWAPVQFYLAREYRRPIYQHFTLQDPSPGVMQKTRYITPGGEMLLFALRVYAYAWYAPSVRPEIEPNLPLSFLFEDVNEAYMRFSCEAGAMLRGCGRTGHRARERSPRAGGGLSSPSAAGACCGTGSDRREWSLLHSGRRTDTGVAPIGCVDPAPLDDARSSVVVRRDACPQGEHADMKGWTRLTVQRDALISFEP
jgi:hypothetical protein